MIDRYRPWKINEVPVGKIIYSKGTKVIITGTGPNIVYLGNGKSVRPEELLDKWVVHGGYPCGHLI